MFLSVCRSIHVCICMYVFISLAAHACFYPFVCLSRHEGESIKTCSLTN